MQVGGSHNNKLGRSLDAALKVILKMSPEIFVNFGPTRLFQLLEALFWPKRTPKLLKCCPTENFGLKMSGFTPH